MPTLSELQDQTALQLVEKLQSPTEGRGLLLNLIGAAGCGKTSVLRRVADKLRREEPWFPVLLAAPNRDNDSGAIALLETAGQLKVRGLLNGEMATLSDPQETLGGQDGRDHGSGGQALRRCGDPLRRAASRYQGEESLLEDTPVLGPIVRRVDCIGRPVPPHCHRLGSRRREAGGSSYSYQARRRPRDARSSRRTGGSAGIMRAGCANPCRSQCRTALRGR